MEIYNFLSCPEMFVAMTVACPLLDGLPYVVS